MAIKDVIYEDELVTKDGDFVVELSEQSHIRDIVFSDKGDWRQHPLVGVGIVRTLNGSETQDSVRKRITLQLEFDNFEVEEIVFLKDKTTRIVANQKENES